MDNPEQKARSSMSTEPPTQGSGDHVLVLAIEPPPPESRALDQINALVRAGHEVSLIAITDDGQNDQELQQSERQGLWTQIRNRKKDPLPDCPGAGARLYKTIFEYFQLYDRSIKDRAYLRKALRLQRSLLSLHWSATVRRERKKQHREFRARVKSMVDKDDKGRTARFFVTVSWYETGVQGYVDGSAEFARRLADVGVPRVIHVHDAFALTSGVLLARRWGVKLVYDAYEHEPERTPLVPDPMKSYVTLFEGGEIVEHGFHDDTIEHGDQSRQPRTLGNERMRRGD